MATPRRRWLQFSLRTAFVVLTVFAIVFGLFVDAGHRQRQARLHVERLGGKVFFDFERSHFTTLARLKSDPPEIVKSKLLSLVGGKDYGSHIAFVDLSGQPVTDADLLPLRDLQRLEYLDLNWTRITDNGLDHLKDLSSLRTLIVRDFYLSKAKIVELQQSLPECRVVVGHFRKMK